MNAMPQDDRSPWRSLLAGLAAGASVVLGIWLVLRLCGWRFWGLE